jgi:mutator protein MutT
MERTRVAAILPMENGYAFMHRKDVIKRKDFQEYYTFPGGGLENGETPEQGVIREIEEEFGIKVKVIKKLYEIKSEKFNQKEIFFLCEYVEGEFGTGTGPEFSNDPKYIDSGKYIPEIVPADKIKDILLLPQDVAKMFLHDFKII